MPTYERFPHHRALTGIVRADYLFQVTYAKQLRHIRSNVFAETQTAFGIIAGVSQGTVSKWERDKLLPEIDQLSKIRDEALRRGLTWQDEWFFRVPPAALMEAS